MRVARGYSGYGLQQGDLIQEGNIGLMKAVKRFDPSMGVRLVSFAVHWIKAEIHEFILRNWRIVKVATTKAQRKLFFNLRRAKKRLGWFLDERNHVAAELGVSPEVVMEMESRMDGHDIGFDIDNSQHDDEGGHHSFAPAQYLEIEDRLRSPYMIESNDSTDQGHSQLTNAMVKLDDRSQDILRQRWLA